MDRWLQLRDSAEMNVAMLVPLRIGGSGGFVKHLSEVVLRWKLSDRIDKISILAPADTLDALGTLGVNVVQVPRNDYRTGFRRMGELVKTGAYDVVLNSIARPVKLNGFPLVTMVQNIEPIQTPTYTMPFHWQLRLWALRREHAIACRQATRVLAVSKYVQDEVCRRFHLGQEKVDVVYHGFNPSEVASVRKPDMNIPDRDFLFSAGSIVPYRGYEDIFRALGEIRSKGINVPMTVLAGSRSGPARSYEKSLRKLAKAVHITDRIIWAGQLLREEMSWCFNNARLYIQTSRAESFSNIQLEAIAHGCLCVSGNNPPMPEILADAASYYPLGDTSALASEIQNVLKMGKKEDGIRRDKARQRASFFSWDKTAEQTLDVLERAIRDFHGKGNVNV